MRKSTKIAKSAPRPEPETVRDACLVHIYPTGPDMGTRYPLTEVSLILGRDPACDITIHDEFVSRNHARIQPCPDGHQVVDLHSTNGTFVNEFRVTAQKLKDGDSIRFGTSICRYLSGNNVEAQYHEEIRRLSEIDALTGAHNQRSFLEYLELELERSARSAQMLALVLFDLDKFKGINDQLGHLGGDYTLRELACCIAELVRPGDFFARYGGEEFTIVLPQTTLDDAVERAERFRQAVEHYSFCYEGKSYPVTISLGVAWVESGQEVSPAELLRRADEKMYEAKNGGRNRVAC